MVEWLQDRRKIALVYLISFGVLGFVTMAIVGWFHLGAGVLARAMGALIILAAAVNVILIRVARSGGYKLDNDHARFIGNADKWSERHLGAWWAGRLALAVVVGLFVAAQGNPGAALTAFIVWARCWTVCPLIIWVKGRNRSLHPDFGRDQGDCNAGEPRQAINESWGLFLLGICHSPQGNGTGTKILHTRYQSLG